MGHGTPPLLPALVGREPELARLDALAEEGTRLVTLVGPPGIGKTRLAAARLEAARRDGHDTAWIALGNARRVEDVCGTVAGALDLRLSWADPADLAAELGWAMAGRDAPRLFFDEAEGCLDALAALLPGWLATAPDARAIVTSRERLRIAGEQVIELGPLPHDGDDDGVLASAAGRMLLDRAGLADLGAERAALAALVRALEGVPLAIELAAARLSLLGPREVTERLAGGLDVLDARPLRGRSTLREAIEASWRGLDAIERRALVACALFQSPFSVAAAEAVIGDPNALEALGGLRDKSLLAREVGGDGRLRLYGPVRAFAEEKRAELEDDGARDRYVATCATIATTHQAAWSDRGDAAALRALVGMVDDLQAAFAEARGGDRVRLALGLAAVFGTRGPQSEALAPLAEAAREPVDTALAAELALAHARALSVCGRVDEALARLDAVGDADPADVDTARAEMELSRGELERCRDAVGRALAVAPERGAARVDALRVAGLAAHARGALEGAFASYDEARHLAAELDLDRRAATLAADLATVRLSQHRLDEARELYEAARAALDPDADGVTLGLVEGNLAILAQEQGRLDDAEASFAQGIARLHRIGHRLFVAHLSGYAGALAHERGRLDEAIERYRAALATLRAVGDARLTAVIAALAGAAEAGRDRIEAAREAFDEAERALERVDDPGVARAAAIHRGHLDLAEGRAGRASADEARRRAAARIEDRIDEGSDDDALEPARRSDDVRLALRLLRAALGLGALGVDRAAHRLTLPDGAVVDLSTRAVLWRLVEAFADRRRDAPGRPLDADALIDAGWPGERLTGDSGTNRLKVALSSLRKLGLRELLLRADDGYLLDPDVPLVDEKSAGPDRAPQ